MPRFQETWCSQCGEDLGPGDSGVSHCHQHRAMPVIHTPREVALLKALSACKGYMLNAVIDLETGTPKATTKNTLNGGIRMIEDVIARVHTP